MRPIQIMLLGGVSIPPVAISSADAFKRTTVLESITAYYSLLSTGGGIHTNSIGDDTEFTWLVSGSASSFQVRVTVLSGTTPGGDGAGSWLSLSTSRAWSLFQSGEGVKSATMLVEIRLISTLVVVGSATVEMRATVVGDFEG